MANEEPVRQREQDLAALQRDIALTEARGTLAAIVSAVIPVTAQIQSWKDQALKEKDKNFEIRDKYLTTVIRDPRHEQRVLEFIVATADDVKIRHWADGQLTRAKEKIAILDDRKRFYLETIGVVSKLADRETGEAEWQKQHDRFWHLYKTDLLPFESPEVESLMVKIGQTLAKCRPGQCSAIEGLAYQLARQMKAEIRADAVPGAAPEAMPRQP